MANKTIKEETLERIEYYRNNKAGNMFDDFYHSHLNYIVESIEIAEHVREQKRELEDAKAKKEMYESLSKLKDLANLNHKNNTGVLMPEEDLIDYLMLKTDYKESVVKEFIKSVQQKDDYVTLNVSVPTGTKEQEEKMRKSFKKHFDEFYSECSEIISNEEDDFVPEQYILEANRQRDEFVSYTESDAENTIDFTNKFNDKE